ncbi:unnamed protein product [Linum trigynum]|uniref:Uncharacterized protein n=1 Tax=Linum trigynum TaxID=586398 RepID=A0AAV2GV48_9ROSI
MEKGEERTEVEEDTAAAANIAGERRPSKEVKGVVVDEDMEEERMKKEGEAEVKGLPHQQVPQPADFSTEPLERALHID